MPVAPCVTYPGIISSWARRGRLNPARRPAGGRGLTAIASLQVDVGVKAWLVSFSAVLLVDGG